MDPIYCSWLWIFELLISKQVEMDELSETLYFYLSVSIYTYTH